MNENSKLRIPNIPQSIDATAKILKTHKENVVSWLLDGTIRACINYRTTFSDDLTYTVGVINSDINVIEKYKEFLNDETLNCPLSHAFSTLHSTISINPYSVPSKITDNVIPFSADLKGLWHISNLEDVASLYTEADSIKIEVNILPYIPDAIYDSYVNEEVDDYINGFVVEALFNDIFISYEDIVRLDNYLNHCTELFKLKDKVLIDNNIKTKKNYPPTDVANMTLVQVLQAYCPFYEELLKEPRGALARLEKDFISKKNDPSFKNLSLPRISESTLARMIIKGKEKLHLN